MLITGGFPHGTDLQVHLGFMQTGMLHLDPGPTHRSQQWLAGNRGADEIRRGPTREWDAGAGGTVALGPNGKNFAARSASPRAALSPENVSPAIVDHQM